MSRPGSIGTPSLFTYAGKGALSLDLDGRKDALGQWVGAGLEDATFWTSVLMACMDGLMGFCDALHAVLPKTIVQRCLVHQIRNSLKYGVYKDQDACLPDLKGIYQAPSREQAETALLSLSDNGAASTPWP